MSYTDEEIEKIAYCIKLHKKRGTQNTLESKIVFDADMLEKSGIGGTFAGYRAQYELGKTMNEWIQIQLSPQRKYTNEDLFTEKAKEISGDGFIEKRKHFKKAEKNLKERKDWNLTEQDIRD